MSESPDNSSPLTAAEPLTVEVVAVVEPPPRPGPGFWMAVGWFVLFVGIEVVVAVIALGAWLATGRPLDLGLLANGNIVLNLVLAALFVAAVHGRQTRRHMAVVGCKPLHLLLGALIVPVLLVINISIAHVVAGWVYGDAPVAGIAASTSLALDEGTPDAFADVHNQMYEDMASEPWWMVIVFGCVLPAVGEELFFRGFLGRGLVARLGAAPGILVASILFALLHLEPAHVCAVFLLGVTLHIIYLTSGSLLLTMGVHFLNNLVAFGGHRWQWDYGRDIAAFGHFDAVGVPKDLLLFAIVLLPLMLLLLAQSRAYWRLPSGEAWAPGYLTAEMPPVELAARHVHCWPSPALLLVVAMLFVVFAVRYGMIIAAAWEGTAALQS